eukprot:TRINITY_DN5226_c0_g2_i1.p1 TRINITY_DN5226_c0_g2~~TRINITY_DN5226_c0_g2_i1.p1  ORF type:complete len:521 (-),score=88.67 TRINITY_DN5226_c0_g2_i1:286-1848(-)
MKGLTMSLASVVQHFVMLQEVLCEPRGFAFFTLLATLPAAPASALILAAEDRHIVDHPETSLFGKSLFRLRGQRRHSQTLSSGGGSCVPLKNHGTHFTVAVSVGTPPQMFEIVADTGSDSLIIPSCLCEATDGRQRSEHCFTGNGKSSTFSLLSANGTLVGGDETAVPVVQVEFGSGAIQAVEVSDVVSVGSVHLQMKNGLLLMVKNALQIEGPFEGILGLGLPKKAHKKTRADREGPAAGFVEQAGIERFTMCFNDGASGVLRLGSQPHQKPLGSIGSFHWGLDFQGISVGKADSAGVTFCKPRSDSQSGGACGAVPDSGSTVMSGPREHLRLLFESLCDEWPRCRKAYEAAPQPKNRVKVFKATLSQCQTWINDSGGLDELPPIFLHVGGAGGEKQVLMLDGATYVLEMVSEATSPNSSSAQDQHRTACEPAFGEVEYTTKSNGPIWILGTPLFYAFQVTYDLATSPPSIAFTDSNCNSCDAGEEEGKSLLTMSHPRPPRQIRRGQQRAPSFDFSNGL